jgi:hypothetical protein
MGLAEIWEFVWKGLTVLGGAGFVAAGVAKFLADRSLEKHKSRLAEETERLKAELGRDAETHKW